MLPVAHQEPSVAITDLLWNRVLHTHTKAFERKNYKRETLQPTACCWDLLGAGLVIRNILKIFRNMNKVINITKMHMESGTNNQT